MASAPGPKGEMNWITLNDAIFADVHAMIAGTGAAVYGRTTYGMMRGYWPTLLDKEDADPEQRAHARWVEQIPKLTFSRTLESSDWNNVRLFRDAGRDGGAETGRGRADADLRQSRADPGLHGAGCDRRILAVPESRPAGRGHSILSRRAPRPGWGWSRPKPFAGGVVRLHYANSS